MIDYKDPGTLNNQDFMLPLGPFRRLQNLGDAEVTFKDESDELVKLPATKLPELPKVFGGVGGMFFVVEKSHKKHTEVQKDEAVV